MPELAFEVARREAENLLLETWDGALPVKLSPVSEHLGATKFETRLDRDLSGFVSKEAGDSPYIVLNSAHLPGRRRFTWAHELGHIVDRMVVAQDNEYSFEDARGNHYDMHEFFADEFAGALLMPAEEFARMRRLGLTYGQMAQEFQVSVQGVMKRRDRLEKHPST